MTNLYFDIRDDQWPLVYDDRYNVRFYGLERCHIFDSKKWRNIIKYLKEANFITGEELVSPLEPSKNDLLVVHTKEYLKSLKWSAKVASIAEVLILACIPNLLVQRAYLRPMRLQTGGSVLAGKLALERGWAINIGGGFHHCSGDRGGGFCPYADITMLIRFLIMEDMIQNAMIVDLDAHQTQLPTSDTCRCQRISQDKKEIESGNSPSIAIFRNKLDEQIFDTYFASEQGILRNSIAVVAIECSTANITGWEGNGYQRDFLGVPEVYIMDMYNKNIYPRDSKAKKAIRRKVELQNRVEDLEYMVKLTKNLQAALSEFKPDILVYNAGTDVLDSDPLGCMRITDIGIIKRDEIVFEMCKENRIPIVMLTSGGYLRTTARIIADSIMNLHRKGLISETAGPQPQQARVKTAS